MKLEKYGNLTLGIVFTLFGIGYLVAAFLVPKSAVMDLGPDVMPKIIATITIVLGFLQTFNGFKEMKAFDETKEQENEGEKLQYWRVGATIAAFIVYVNLIEVIGFLIMTFIYLVVQMNILSVKEDRRQLLFVIISLITSLLVYFLFRNGFNIMIPAGILG